MAVKETQSTKIALIQQDMQYVKEGMKDLKDGMDEVNKKLNDRYVSKEEFEPIKKVVYGLVGLILVAVVGAIISLVVKA